MNLLNRKPKSPAGQIAWCERSTATVMSPHHLRVLTDAGLKKSGGADTLALCGAEVAWDLSVVSRDAALAADGARWGANFPCPKCIEALAHS